MGVSIRIIQKWKVRHASLGVVCVRFFHVCKVLHDSGCMSLSRKVYFLKQNDNIDSRFQVSHWLNDSLGNLTLGESRGRTPDRLFYFFIYSFT